MQRDSWQYCHRPMERPPVILIVDDNDAIRRLVSMILQREGMEIEHAFDGAKAIERLSQKSYDAVFLDLMMPRTDGFEVITYLREHKPEVLTKVIVMTAAMSKLTSRELDAVGDVLSKPFEIDVLVQTVRKALARGA